ncbi:MAG: SMP-30/gluconolactonase/LRE family protein [Verrucomicrobiota bacterium]
MKLPVTILLTFPVWLFSSPVDETAPLERIAHDFELADGPSWDGWSLVIPDVKAGALYRYTPAKNSVTLLMKEAGRISGTFFNHGRLYLSDNSSARISQLVGKDNKSRQARVLHSEDGEVKPPRKPNDLVVDNKGGVYFTLTRQNAVVYIAPDGTSRVVTEEVETANGITLSPDQRTLYVASFVPKEIIAFGVLQDGSLENRKVFAKMDDGDAKGADGMCIDRAGNVYCAGATDIWIWNPEGKLIDKIACPERPINATFGGQRGRDLFITGFGGLYVQKMKVGGLPPHPALEEADFDSRNGTRPSTVIGDDIKSHLDVVYAENGTRKVLCDIFRPNSKAEETLPAVVTIHGGGWLNGDRMKFRAMGLEFARRGYVSMVIDYRLGHEAPFPAGIEDCHAAVRYLRANADKFGVDPNLIFGVGGSAGGHLVGLLAVSADNEELHGSAGNPGISSRIAGAVVMAGPMEMTTGSVAERSLSNPDTSNSNAWLRKTIEEAPELYALADAHLQITEDDPPILFMAGEFDKPERNEPSREKLRSFGIETGIKSYEKGKHGCWNQNPWFDQMMADMDDWFRKVAQTSSR